MIVLVLDINSNALIFGGNSPANKTQTLKSTLSTTFSALHVNRQCFSPVLTEIVIDPTLDHRMPTTLA